MKGTFSLPTAKAFPIAPGFLEGDWGLSHIVWSTGDGTAPAPESFEVRWFSYPEDKFYEGHFLLPQKKIHDLLQQGYWNADDKQHETYHNLTLCLLPKGVVVVWLAGQNQVLIGRYEGREIDFDFKLFNEAANRPRMIAQEQAKLPPAVQEQIRTGTLSTKQWDTYLKTYDWKVVFSQPLKLYGCGVGYTNAEKKSYPPNREVALAYAQTLLTPGARPVPQDMYLQVNAGYGRKRQIQVRKFDEEETLAAFQALHAANPTLPLTLCIDTDARVDSARLFLKNERQQIELTKSPVLLFDAQ